MARKKKNTKIVEEVVENINPIVEESATETIEETPVETVEEAQVETPVVEEKQDEGITVAEETELGIEKEKKEVEKKISEGTAALEEMKLAWKKRLHGNNDSQTNLYTYNIGSIL